MTSTVTTFHSKNVLGTLYCEAMIYKVNSSQQVTCIIDCPVKRNMIKILSKYAVINECKLLVTKAVNFRDWLFLKQLWEPKCRSLLANVEKCIIVPNWTMA